MLDDTPAPHMQRRTFFIKNIYVQQMLDDTPAPSLPLRDNAKDYFYRMNSFCRIHFQFCLFCLFSLLPFNLFAQQIDSVRNENAVIYFQLYGQGEPIYLLSGGPGISPDYLKGLTEHLATSNLVVVVHQRGTGLTKGPFNEEDISIDLYCRDIHAIKEKLKHDKFILLGHSWGGMLAMHFATMFPDDLSKLLLVSSGGCNLTFFNYFGDNINAGLSKEKQDSSRLLSARYAQLVGIPGDSAKQLYFPVLFDLFNVNSSGYYYDKSLAPAKKLTQDNFNLRVNRFMINKLYKDQWDVRDELAKVNVPTRIIIGRQDPVDLETAWVMRDAIPGSQLVVIEKCGHFPWVEQRERFFSVVTEFLGRRP
jgi:proline iminopeptidase